MGEMAAGWEHESTTLYEKTLPEFSLVFSLRVLVLSGILIP